MYYVYILESIDSDRKRYIGYTSDLKRRFKEHNSDKNSGYTRNRKWSLIYYEAFLDRAVAMKRESSLKNNGRARKILYERIGNPRSR